MFKHKLGNEFGKAFQQLKIAIGKLLADKLAHLAIMDGVLNVVVLVAVFGQNHIQIQDKRLFLLALPVVHANERVGFHAV